METKKGFPAGRNEEAAKTVFRGSPFTWFDIPLVNEFSLNLYLRTYTNWLKFRFGEELLVNKSTEFCDQIWNGSQF